MGEGLSSNYKPKTIDILKESLADKPYSDQSTSSDDQSTSSDDAQDEVRYKLNESLPDKPYSDQSTSSDDQSTSSDDQSTSSDDQSTSSDDAQDEVRYKLIIDPSEDESLTRLLLMFDILKSDNTRTFMCSNFPGDSQLQKVFLYVECMSCTFYSCR